MKKIGYMGGMDALLLSKLAVRGADTAPLGNGWDNHGMYLGHLNPADGIDAVVGFFHKFLPLEGSNICATDLLKPCAIHNIPVFVIAAKEDLAKAKEMIGDCGPNVKFVDPAGATKELLALV